MPAGVSWGQYLKFFSAAMLSMFAGSQLVYMYYRPLDDLDVYVKKQLEGLDYSELKTAKIVEKVVKS